MLLEARDLCKEYRGLRGQPDRALQGVSLGLRTGEALAVIGESGAGKTTLARCLLRLVEPSSGRIFFAGQDLEELSARQLRRLRRRFQPVFQDPWASLNPRMTVARLVEEPLKVHGLGDAAARRERVSEILGQVELAPGLCSRLPRELSGGQRQRVAIGRALATGPDLLVADEAVSFLDPPVQVQILDLLAELKRRQGLAILFVSHALPSVRRLCDRVAVLYRGCVVELAPAGRIFSEPIHSHTRSLLDLAAPPPSSGEGPARPGPGARLKEVDAGHWVLKE